MVDHEDQIGFIIVIVVLVTLVLGIRKYLQFKKRLFKMNLQERLAANQQEDVYNISSRVQGQEQGQWPTHDNHVSLEHFTINETNKYNDDPPTYEEAMRIAAANNNNTAVAAVPKTTVTPTSTSTSTANQQ
ncbi:uncharacterized protein LOC664363 isoform X4 [Tribolium castaneum]|uniref:Uncharacterized protein n=1 Tax=Tribolium castaneum TaxID=7070 RepID=A0A139WEQ8_TRICA|nr:PREDICTED: uncharacterized protein LOC664363 isoform X5 [Tribolium castaneum]KYB26402.1 hypothetical protein TcasGA2_TC033782 [Tribolium castaneum]|eukprot:XP_008195918.1 PREDICTED: uncharacterized protein LOC664363 isoform X5 [Tribolium castaneum]